MSWWLSDPIDFEEHNAEVAELWEAYYRGRPSRVPVLVSGSIRSLFQTPGVNTTGYTFEDFFNDPDAQIKCQLAYQKWYRYHVLCDHEMGPPKDGWQLGVDFQNTYDASWFGCPLRFDGNAVPDTLEILKDDKYSLLEKGCPDPLKAGLIGRAVEFFEHIHQRCRTLEFEGLPVRPPRTIPGDSTDGPLSVAYKLRGATEICIDMLTDPSYFHELMTFITDCIIRRMKAIRGWAQSRYSEPAVEKPAGWYRFMFPDDAVVLLSLEQYQEFVFPYHRRLVEEFNQGEPVGVHLCGDATRFFRFMHDHLNAYSFDTGFPVDHGALRDDLGPDVEITGGPPAMLVKDGSPSAIRDKVREICESGIMEGGRFVLIAANNVAPCTPADHIVALYDAAKEHGRYHYQ